MTIDEPYRWRIDARMGAPAGSGWRARIAFKLRRWSDQLDARHTVAYHIHTTPEISPTAVGTVLRRGAVAMSAALEAECAADARERLFRRTAPAYLFEDLK